MKYITLILSLLLTGCSASGPLFQKVKLKDQDKSIIYIYRIDSQTMILRKACFSLDGKSLIELKNNGYTYLVTNPGKHKIRHNWEKEALDSQGLKKTIEIDVLASPCEAAYVELYPSSVLESSFRGTVTEVRWILRQVPELYGEKAIQECRYEENLIYNTQ